MKNDSLWLADSKGPQFPKAHGSLKVDVLVIGGGITGVTAAYLLKKAGCTVALVERYHIGGAETGHTTAHLTQVTDTRLGELVSHLGKQEALAFWEAGLSAMQQIEALVAEHEIDCGLKHVPGYLFAAEDKDAEKESKSLQRDAGLARELDFDAEFLASAPIFSRPGVRFPNQLKLHPLKYLYSLAREVPGDGSHVVENSDASKLDDKKQELHLPDCKIHYGSVVVATNMPLQGARGTFEAALFQTKLSAYSSYAIEARLPKADVFESLFWDTADPYYYYRFDRRDETYSVIIGGEDHKTGQDDRTEDRYEALEKKLRKHFPDARPEYRWSGQVVETPDGLPYIGECGERQFLATGFSGNGITLGTFSAMLIRDLIAGRANPWTDLFSPHRKRVAGVWQYLRENKDFPLYLVKDHLAKAGEEKEKIHRNSGEILKVDGKKCAVYCDEHGKRTVLSAVCPHMGCIVHWNDAEKTWDCPCHGSRFSATGELMGGPAEKGLEPV